MILSKWFKKHATVALCISAAGSGFGGTFFPLLIEGLLPWLGYMLTMAICAGVNVLLLSIVCLTMKMPKDVGHERCRIDLRTLLKDTRFVLMITGSAIFVAGYYTIMTFIVAVANARGMANASIALAVASGCRYDLHFLCDKMQYETCQRSNKSGSIPGRLASGWIGQLLGLEITLILFTFIAWVLTLVLFASTTSISATLVYCAAWGFFSSSSISLVPAIIFKISPHQEVSVRLGFAYSLMSLMVLIGSPIGALLVGDSRDYRTLILVCGACQAAGWILWVVAQLHRKKMPDEETF